MAATGLTALFTVAVVIGAIFGLVRGLNKATIRIVTLILAAILTFVIAGPVTLKVVESAQLGEMVLELLYSEENVAAFLESMPLLKETVLVMPAFALCIVVFPVLFWLLKFITWIVFAIVQKPLRKLIFGEKEGEEVSSGARVGQRLGGLGVGIVTGALIFAMLLTPVFGLMSMMPASATVEQTLNVLVEQDYISDADAAGIREAYAVKDSFVVNAMNAVGISTAGRAYIDSVATVEVDGQTVSLADELNALLGVLQTAVENDVLGALTTAEDPAALYGLLADQAFVDALMQDLFQSKLLRSVVPKIMATAMESVAQSMNVPADKNAVYDNMMDKIAVAVQTADIDFAAMEAYEKAHGIVYTYARSASVFHTDPQTGLLTEQEYGAEVQKLNGLVQQISSVLNRSMSGENTAFTDSVASQIVSSVKTQAAENGQQVIENFDAASVQDAIANLDAANLQAGESDVATLLEQLTDKEKFETDMPTVESIVESIEASVTNAVANDEKASETASTLASVVSNFASAVSSATGENGELDASKLDFEKIASAVTELQNSELKDVGSSVLDIVAGGDLGDNSMLSDMVDAVKEGYENGEDIGGTIGTAGALIGLGSAMNNAGEAGQEAVVDSLISLISNLNEFTIGLLPTILSTDTITSLGVPAEYADATFSVIETLLKELMKLKDAEDYSNEVNSILSLYEIATSGVTEFTEADVADLTAHALESDAIYNTLISVSTSNPFGIEIPDASVRADLVDAIEGQYAQSGKTQRERDLYQAVAVLLGLDGEISLG